MERNAKNGIFHFFDAERKRFVAFLKRRMADLSEMDAEDMVAEVMLAMLNKADPSHHVENLTAYVYRSLSNKLADLLRRRRHAVSLDRLPDDDGESSLMDFLADGNADVGTRLERKELRLRLAEAISRLEPKARAVFIATELKGRSFKELSAQWNEPVGTLLSRKSRAVKTLRELLKDDAP